MSKTVITDEMVERAYDSIEREGDVWSAASEKDARAGLRRALEAALNPPAEPEVEVTEKMLDAAQDVMKYAWRSPSNEGYARIYRAMHSARPKGEDLKPPHGGEERRVPRMDSLFGSNVWGLSNGTFLHRREKQNESKLREHRRKDDTWDGFGPGGA